MSVLAFISGHGFGHWTRSSAVLRRLADERPIHVRTNLRASILARHADWAASVGTWDLGPGVSQRGPLEVDVPATLGAWEAHEAAWAAQREEALSEARALGVRLVYADVPPCAFSFARDLGVPSLAVANFPWSWIVSNLPDAPGAAALGARLAAQEACASAAVYLPGGGGLESLGPPRAELLLRREPTLSRAEARAQMPRPAGTTGRPLVVVSFGGFGSDISLGAAAALNPEFEFLAFGGEDPQLSNLLVLPHDHGRPHQDLVLGADAVISKPGYGTVSECLAGPTPLVWCEPAPAFCEHAVLAERIQAWLPHAPISREDLLAGRWSEPLRRALASTPRTRSPDNGLEQLVSLADEMWRGAPL